ncbi:MAG: hypothetical protein EX271_04175 [Acidimicrobiales bacterium]|nr:hypothetical protein [Hyphomonadaceae bacterium]RZV43261.1 MAG: hypothetical protein EX271_04175 [Acidimicrobiales bacterium]
METAQPKLKRQKSNLLLQIPGWILVLYLIYSQAIPAIDYELGVAMGTQEPASEVSEVGVAFWRGFAIADLVAYIPLFIVGLIGYYLQKTWGRIALAASLGISIYWPITCLTAVVIAQNSDAWTMSIPFIFWIVLPAIVLWSLWGLVELTKDA